MHDAGEGDGPTERGGSASERGPLSRSRAAAALGGLLGRPSAAPPLGAPCVTARPSAAAARRLAITLARPSSAGSMTGETALLMSTHSPTCLGLGRGFGSGVGRKQGGSAFGQRPLRRRLTAQAHASGRAPGPARRQSASWAALAWAALAWVSTCVGDRAPVRRAVRTRAERGDVLVPAGRHLGTVGGAGSQDPAGRAPTTASAKH